MEKINYAKTRERDSNGRFLKPTTPSGFDVIKYRKEYYQKNKKRRTEIAREWSRKNPEKSKIIKDRWRSKNRERTNFLTRQYHYRKKHAEGNSTFEEIKELYSFFPLCPYCNKNKPNTIDHMIPLSRGGTNDKNNLIPVCINCNSRKGSKTLAEFNPILLMMWERMNI